MSASIGDGIATGSAPGGGAAGVPTSRQVIAGAGLTGGGDLSADRTLDVVAANSTITVNADSIQVGTVPGTQVTPDFGAQAITTTGPFNTPGTGTRAAAGDFRTGSAFTWKYLVGATQRSAIELTSGAIVIIGGFTTECAQVLVRAGTGADARFQVAGGNCFIATTTQLKAVLPLTGSSADSVPFRWERADITKSDATDLTLSAAQYECPVLNFSGVPTGAFNVIGPNISKAFFWVINGTNQAMTFKKAGGVTTLVIAAGKVAAVAHTGTEYVRLTPDA